MPLDALIANNYGPLEMAYMVGDLAMPVLQMGWWWEE